jgi:Tol biopolymer transport system component
MEEVMACPKCGFENEAGRETCSNCGASLISEEPQETQEKTSRMSVWGWVVAALIVALVGAALFIFKGSVLKASEPQLYAVLGDNVIPFAEMGVLENGGTEVVPFTSSSSSVAIAPFAVRAGHSFLSSAGQIAILGDANLNGSGQVMLVDIKGGAVSTATETPLSLTVSANFQSFSPDGKYFGYTSISSDGTTLNAVIVNERAATVLVSENLIFAEILPDSEHFLAYTLDLTTGNPTGLVSVAIPSGEQTVLYQTTGTDILSGIDVVSPDKNIYFVLQGGETGAAMIIYRMGVDGSDPTPIYTFQQPVSFFGVISIAPDEKNLLVLEVNEAGTGYDLLLLNPNDQAVTKLASNVNAEFYSDAVFLRQMYGEMVITFSPDGKYLAYMVSEGSGMSLYVSDVATQTATLIASGQVGYSFAFSPDSDQLIYVQYASDNMITGSLFAADLKGASTQLDENVTSFSFQDGKLIYFGVLTSDQTTSTLYQSKLDGQDKTELLSGESGYWVLLKLPE